MLQLSGVIKRKEYFYNLLILIIELFVVSFLLLALMELLNAEEPSAPPLNQGVAIVAFLALILNSIFVIVAEFSLVIRRARDTGATVLWSVLSYSHSKTKTAFFAIL